MRQKMKRRVNIKKEMYVINHKQTDRKEILRKQCKRKVKAGIQYCAS